MQAVQTFYGDELGEAIVPVDDENFITGLAYEVLCGAELDDLWSPFAEEMRMCKLDEA